MRYWKLNDEKLYFYSFLTQNARWLLKIDFCAMGLFFRNGGSKF